MRQSYLSVWKGQTIPSKEQLKDDYTLKSCIHAIRSSLEYAKSPGVANLCTDTQDPACQAVLRARNARFIMSDLVDDVKADTENSTPYCIWYPLVAREDTYRQLVAKFPSMSYQVARACAVAGYSTLYHSLSVLPDISVAEEARESVIARDIFETIMSSPVRYEVMNDYTRSVSTSSPPVKGLNRDTCVCRQLSSKQLYWDICEDGGLAIDDDCVQEESIGYNIDNRWLLYSPLPYDLPICDKDVLICLAAYQGNIDRYARLRRPMLVNNELGCILRGIVHNTSFAKWCSINLSQHTRIRAAVHTRFTMINDISWWKPGLDQDELPSLFWWPLKPMEHVLLRLSELESRMHAVIKQAAIACNFERLYNAIKVPPDDGLIEEAGRCPNKYFALDLAAHKDEYKGRRSVEHDLELLEEFDPEETWNVLYVGKYVDTSLFNSLEYDEEGLEPVNSSQIDLLISVPDSIIARAANQPGITSVQLPLQDDSALP